MNIGYVGHKTGEIIIVLSTNLPSLVAVTCLSSLKGLCAVFFTMHFKCIIKSKIFVQAITNQSNA